MVSSKKDLINVYSEKYGVSKKAAEESVNNVLEVLTEAIENGGVCIKEQFTIKLTERKGRDFKNPKTGEMTHKDDYNTLTIKVGSKMKESIN
jgi:nucleoid DNA-binding protein